MRAAGRAERRLDSLLVVAAATALATVVIEHGFRTGPDFVPWLRFAGIASVLVFAGSQAAKLLVVERPLEYLRSHRPDFSLFFVLAAQAWVHLSLRSSDEYLLLERAGAPSPLWAFHVAVMQVYVIAIVALQSHRVHVLLVRLRLRPAQALVLSFLSLIALGALLLALPGASRDGRSAGWVDALFTSTSAVCVTGLVVRDTGTQFSAAGQAAILGLVQAGGLGMLMITTFFAVFGRGRLPPGQVQAIHAILNVDSAQEMRRTLRRVLVATAAVEVAGACALYAAWGTALPDPVERAAWATFHSVSAFCNAGFALFPGNASLTGPGGSAAALLVVGALIVAGGLGFGVLGELARWAGSRLRLVRARPLTRNARWVLAVTALLLAGGTALFAAAERSGALAALDEPQRWVHAAFQSASLRTAGFNSIDLASLGLPATLLCIAFMLVGGSPASTAGGMKTTTAALTVAAALRRPRVEPALRRPALRAAGLYLACFASSALLLALLQGEWSRRTAFEAASALGTVGLTMGVTPELGVAAKLLLCVVMFVGRVGPFALAAALARRAEIETHGPDEERILLG